MLLALAIGNTDQFYAAAAEIGHHAVGIRERRYDTLGGKPRFLLARQDLDLEAAFPLYPVNEIRAVHRIANGGRRDRPNSAGIHRVG